MDSVNSKENSDIDPSLLDSPIANVERIYLIGPMGAGKTTVGRQLANLLGYDFVDTDQYIIDQTGVSIAWIFDKEGESGFRERETQALIALSKKSQVVIATGGGIVTQTINHSIMSNSGYIIYLQTDVATQWQRTKHDKSRPLLQQPNPLQVLTRLYQQRHPIYQRLANYIAPSSYQPPHIMAKSLYQVIKHPQR